MNLNRRAFLASLVVGSATFIVNAVLTACGKTTGTGTGTGTGSGTGTGTGSSANCTTNGASGAFTSNHGHSLVIGASDVNGGTQKTYDVTGSSGHLHTVTITAANFTTLAGGGSVTATATDSGSGHTHSVTVTCA